jgi:hypothetical protein
MLSHQCVTHFFILTASNLCLKLVSTSYPGSFHYAPRWRKDPGPGLSRVSQILRDNNWDLWGVGGGGGGGGGGEGKCDVRV